MSGNVLLVIIHFVIVFFILPVQNVKKPIGPVTCPVNPFLYKTPYHGKGKIESWELELATDFRGFNTVYKSKRMRTNDSIKIDTNSGTFINSLKGKIHLIAGDTYFCRVRQKCSDGSWSDWSRWHQPFNVAED